MKKYLGTLVSLLLIIAFTACGGGGGDSSAPASTANSISFSGTAVDGYIKEATACLDINVNDNCDNNEPTTLTRIDGTFTFTDIEVDDDILIPIIISGGFDTATGNMFLGKLRNIINTKNISQNTSFTVSPLTDLVAAAFLALNDKSDTMLNQIKSNVAASLGLSVEKVDADPMKDKEVFAKAQEIQQTKELILTSAAKAANIASGTTESDELAKSITEAIAESIQNNSTLDTSNAITKLEEIESSVTIPANEKEFIVLQVTEIKDSLADMVIDTTVTADDLDQRQIDLEDRVEIALVSIKEATPDTDITIIITTIKKNTAPVSNAGLTQNVNTNVTVQLDGSKSFDDDLNDITYKWNTVSKPINSNVLLTNSDIVNPEFIADKEGTYIFSLIVNDGTVNSFISEVIINVTEKFHNNENNTTLDDNNENNTTGNARFSIVETSVADMPIIIRNNETDEYLTYQTNEDSRTINGFTIHGKDTILTVTYDKKNYPLTASTDELMFIFSNYTSHSVGISIISNDGEILEEYSTFEFDDELVLEMETLLSKESLKRSINFNVNDVFKFTSITLSLIGKSMSNSFELVKNPKQQLSINLVKVITKDFIKGSNDDIKVAIEIVDLSIDVVKCPTNPLNCLSVFSYTLDKITELCKIYKEIESANTEEINMQHHLDIIDNILKVRKARKEKLLENQVLKSETELIPVEYDDENTKCTRFSRDIDCLIAKEEECIANNQVIRNTGTQIYCEDEVKVCSGEKVRISDTKTVAYYAPLTNSYGNIITNLLCKVTSYNQDTSIDTIVEYSDPVSIEYWNDERTDKIFVYDTTETKTISYYPDGLIKSKIEYSNLLLTDNHTLDSVSKSYTEYLKDTGNISSIREYSIPLKTDNGYWISVNESYTKYASPENIWSTIEEYSIPLKHDNGYWTSVLKSRIAKNTDANLTSSQIYSEPIKVDTTWRSYLVYFKDARHENIYLYPYLREDGSLAYTILYDASIKENNIVSRLYRFTEPLQNDDGTWQSHIIYAFQSNTSTTLSTITSGVLKNSNGVWQTFVKEAKLTFTYNDKNISMRTTNYDTPFENNIGNVVSVPATTTSYDCRYNAIASIMIYSEAFPSSLEVFQPNGWGSNRINVKGYYYDNTDPNLRTKLRSQQEFSIKFNDSLQSKQSYITKNIAYWINGKVSHLTEYYDPLLSDKLLHSFITLPSKDTDYREDGTVSRIDIYSAPSKDINGEWYNDISSSQRF